MLTQTNIRIKNLNFLRNYGLNPNHWVETQIKTTADHMTLLLQNIEDPSLLLEAILEKNCLEMVCCSLKLNSI